MPRYHVAAREYLPKGGPPLAVIAGDHGRDVPVHDHEFDELVVVAGGRGRHLTEADGSSEAHAIAAGDVLFIPGGVAHGYHSVRDLRLINVLSDPERLHLPRQDLARLPAWQVLFRLEAHRRRRGQHDRPGIHLAPAALRRARRLADDLHATLARATAGQRFEALARYMDLLLHLLRHASLAEPRVSERIARILVAIEAEPQRPWTVAGLARRAGLSPRHFQRLFVDGVGRSPLAYVLDLRIERAQTLLRASADSVTSIALACGFDDGNYFARQFRRRVGCSPRQWRASGRRN